MQFAAGSCCNRDWSHSAGLALARTAQSQDYPAKPITMIVPYAAGRGRPTRSAVW